MKRGRITFALKLPTSGTTSFVGSFNPEVQIQFYGMFDTRVSLANVCNQFAQRLTDEFDHVGLHSYNGPFVDAKQQEYTAINFNAPIGIFYGIPTQVPCHFTDHATTIGCFVCETDRIHDTWVKVCNQLDYIVVPTRFCQQAFTDSGVRSPIIVVPHGLELEYRPYKPKLRSKPMVFYNTFYSQSFHSRKSAEELIRTFLKTFSGQDDVILKLRTQNSKKMTELKEKYDFGRLIEIEPITDCGTEEFARIYSDVHCTVHPSKGEGFGLIPFQSIACETPVIAAPVTGMADYLNQDNAILLKTNGRVKGEGGGCQAGTYYSIDEDHLADCLRHVYDHWELEYDKVHKVAKAFREKHSWENALSGFVSLVESINNRRRV